MFNGLFSGRDHSLLWGSSFSQDFAPETGTFIKAGEMNGLCRLDIINNQQWVR
jgi:hypothetical protein